MNFPMKITIREVGPRDGLQNEDPVSVDDRVLLIDRLSQTGLRYIEVTSFVRSDLVPQMAGAEEVWQRVKKSPGVVYSALVLNTKGARRALDCGFEHLQFVLSASETHNQKNAGRSRAESLKELEAVVELCLEAGASLSCTVSTAWGCPYEGPVDPGEVGRIAGEAKAMGCRGISLGDTIGVANPAAVVKVIEAVEEATGVGADAPGDPPFFNMHFHDTRGLGLANVLAAMDRGVSYFDASVGGLGGCPYAPGAAGNLATEELVFMANSMGIETGVDIARLLEVAELASQMVGRKLPSRVLEAGISWYPGQA
jgi:hydroxymethylglutaryl-CoA lyase